MSEQVGDKVRLINRFMGRRGGDPLTPLLLPVIRHEPFRACLESILGPVVIGGTDAPIRAKIPLDPVLAGEKPGQCRTPWHQVRPLDGTGVRTCF